MNLPYIICSAIHYDDGISHLHQPINIKTGYVIAGRRHHNIIINMDILGIKTQRENIQGFLTSDDRFVDRAEALQIAVDSEQCQPEELKFKVLFSEDIY